MSVTPAVRPDEKTVQAWWMTPSIYEDGEIVLDDEARLLQAMQDDLDDLPAWALRIRSAMPVYGFEMCGHRWLDGLGEVLAMIGDETDRPTETGRCGEIPFAIFAGMLSRADAAGRWSRAVSPIPGSLDEEVFAGLGERTPEKIEAAQAFAVMINAACVSKNDLANAASVYRERSTANAALQRLYEGVGLEEALNNACGYRILAQLDLMVREIGGEATAAEDRLVCCNSLLRTVFRDDPERYTVTRGILWGLYAVLNGKDETWIRAEKPDCAGAAIHALRLVSRTGESTPLRRWLVASLLKTTKIWCEEALKRVPPDSRPPYADDLPSLAV